VGDDLAVVDEHDVVGEPLPLVEQVRGQHDGHAVAAERLDQLPGGVAGLRVEAGGRLVEEDQLGPADDRERQGQALLHNPDVLILDEPTAGLDPKQIIETRRLIKELAGDHTIILSSHILPEVSQTCQRVVIINKGRVVAVDTPDNLTATLRGSEAMYVEIDAAGANAQPLLSNLPGVTTVNETPTRAGYVAFEVQSEQGRDVRREIASAIVRQGWGLLELRPMRMSLEEIFLSLTTEDSVTAPEAGRE
jgi:ABC-2 type transport system ATP-binding protein